MTPGQADDVAEGMEFPAATTIILCRSAAMADKKKSAPFA
jgi:hypothetical protein